MPMLIGEFLNYLLDDVLEEAREAHLSRPDILRFNGTERAVMECRAAMTTAEVIHPRLSHLLANARMNADQAVAIDLPDAWFWMARAETVEWVAKVVSVVLLNQRLPTIVPPTRPAAVVAARLAGAVGVE